VSPVPCDLAAIVREQVATQRVAAPERAIELHLPGSGPINVMADADRIGQVLANFITNALKYSSGDQPVEVRLRCSRGRVRVAVRDHGPGLTPEEQVRVWEMFHRIPGVEVQSEVGMKSGSLGLGLHICKQIVELHPGGQVGIRSKVGQGSTFWFELPVAALTD
jgi:signal transduction histidine kinase